MMRGGRFVGFGAALLLGAAAGLLLWPMVQREMMLHRLLSNDPAQRSMAVQWWSQPASPYEPSVRLAQRPSIANRLIQRLEGVEEQDVFVDAASLLLETDYWRIPLISTTLWTRRLNLILDSNDDAAAEGVLDELTTADVPRDDGSALTLWQRLLSWPDSAGVRRRALFDAATWFGRTGVEPWAAAARGDSDSGVRRSAWLLLGLVHPVSGYAGQWKGEEPGVAEAMLWAATLTNPDDASPLLVACDQSPWPSPALPWLLSRSDDLAAQSQLEALVVDGNRAAALHLAERWGVGLERLSAAQQVWLGKVVTRGEAEDPVLDRWVAWRGARENIGALLDDPVAQDGSVWAAVLLAQRLLSRDATTALAERWLSDLNPAVRRGGVLLMGLSGADAQRLSQEYRESADPSFRRATRLAVLMARVGSQATDASSTGRAYAWTVLTAQTDERMDAMLALLASGDERAVCAILTRPTELPAGAAMLERAWLIERFLPDYAAMVAPLCPWNDGVAALQFDIMRAAFALGGRDSFDPQARVFRYATSTPSR